MSSTAILKVRIVSGSGKVREGNPGDDKKDLEKDDVVDRVWTGVVPVWQTVGEPVPSKINHVSDIPEYIRAWKNDENELNKRIAVDAAKALYPKPKAKPS